MQETILNKVSKYKFTLNNFEGPLDLLLYLITKNKMSIFDISLSDLTDEYILYLNELTEHSLEITSEFIVMAATLLDIKAKKLLPELDEKENEEDEITEEDIINRIIEYKKYKEISNNIMDMYSKYFGSFSKQPEKIKYKIEKIYSGQKLEVNNLCSLYTDLLEKNFNKMNKKRNELDKLAVYEKVTVESKVKEIVNYLQANKHMVFNQVFNVNSCENIEVVTAFLGVLELSKLKQVDISQQYLFSDINIEKRNDKVTIDVTKLVE